MIRLDAATVLLQWATGGLLFLWVTTRGRQVGIGYGWLLRGVYGAMAVGALIAGAALSPLAARDLCSGLVAVGTTVALAASVVRRKAGVAGEHDRRQERADRVAAMVGRPTAGVGDGNGDPETDAPLPADRRGGHEPGPLKEFPPLLDLLAPLFGVVGLIAAALDAGGPDGLAIARTLAGAAFLGAVTDAMLLGHWYLVQPGLRGQPLRELVRWTAIVWPVEVATLLWPTGMFSVLSGSVDDGWNGTLGWFWLACAVTTIVLLGVTRAALREREYSAVMAATGLLYLAILTAFGTDLVARAVLTA